MKLEPAWIIPTQKRSTTPDVFISDQYGRLPGPNDDGAFYLDLETRLSHVVNGLTPAFKENDSVISGLTIDRRTSKTYVSGNDLIFKIDEGTGIINNRVFRIPNHIISTWKNFAKDIPSSLLKGKVLIYFAHSEIYVNDPERPYQRSIPPRQSNETLPHDQSTFNPVVVCGAWYDPVTKQVTSNSSWDYFEHKIILSGNLWYEKNPGTGVTKIWWDDDDISDIEITGPNGTEIIPQQGTNTFLAVVDGGPLEPVAPSSVRSNAVSFFFNETTTKYKESFALPSMVPNINLSYCFYNGILYKPVRDYNIMASTNELTFVDSDIVVPKKIIKLFQFTPSNPNGYLEILSDGIMTSSRTTQNVPGLKTGDKCIVHVNGLLVKSTEYAITTDTITFTATLNVNDWVRVSRIVPGTSSTSYVEHVYCGLASNGTTMSIFGLSPTRKYLVFYPMVKFKLF